MKHVFSVLSVVCVAFFTLFISTTNVSCGKGDTGPKGDTGVANAIYSDWKSVTFQGAILNTGDTVGSAILKAPEITQDVLDKATIHVYWNFGASDNSNIVQVPLFDIYYGLYISADYQVGQINLISNTDASGKYRYIIVKGSVPATGGRQATIDWSNYAEVKKALNLKD